MNQSKEKTQLNDKLLKQVAGGDGLDNPEYVYYDQDPDRYTMILNGTCPHCRQSTVVWYGMGYYGCFSCKAGYALVR